MPVDYIFPVGDYTELENVNEKMIRLYNKYKDVVEASGGNITWVRSFSTNPAMLLVRVPDDVDPSHLIPDRPFEKEDFKTDAF
jgi:hypothetical protein